MSAAARGLHQQEVSQESSSGALVWDASEVEGFLHATFQVGQLLPRWGMQSSEAG